MCIRGEEKDEYSIVDSPSADNDAQKRILKCYIVSVGASEVFIMQFDFFASRGPLIRICMTPHTHVV